MKKVIVLALTFASTAALAAPKVGRPAQKAAKSDGFDPVYGYAKKNAAYFAKYDRDVASGKLKGPYVITAKDREYNARGANPPGWNAMIDMMRPAANAAMQTSILLNPIGTMWGVRTYNSMNEWKLGAM